MQENHHRVSSGSSNEDIRGGAPPLGARQDESFVAVIESLLFRTDVANLSLGDLFLGETSAWFIPYGSIMSWSTGAYAPAAFAGGLAGAALLKFSEGKATEVLPRAKDARILDWGMSPQARAQRHPGAVEILRSNVKSVVITDHIAIHTDGRMFVFTPAFPESSGEFSDILRSWEAGTLATPNSQTVQLAPSDFVASCLSAENRPSNETILALSRDAEYMKRLFEVVRITPNNKKYELLVAWQSMPVAFKSQVSQFLGEERDSYKSTRIRMWVGRVAVLVPLLALGIASVLLDGNELFKLLGLGCFGLIALGIGSIVSFRKYRAQAEFFLSREN